jgi:helicase SWR1
MNEFQTSHKRQLAILQIIAAGTGLTLTRASNAVGIEMSWVPGRNEQVEDRIHRIGQTRDVEITMLAYQHSVETRVLKAGASKERSASRVLDANIVELLTNMEEAG